MGRLYGLNWTPGAGPDTPGSLYEHTVRIRLTLPCSG